ncbi:MAG TPA: hypothetical protein VHD38_00570, partial [Candidatus Paceibacterota bacterium]|nr:hypothetical protein [Candidatus Paceibacterota bacterium]
SHWERTATSSRGAYINVDTAIANTLSDILGTYMKNMKSASDDDLPQQMKEYSASAICAITVNGRLLRQVSRKTIVRGAFYAQEDAIGESVFKAFVAAGLPIAAK